MTTKKAERTGDPAPVAVPWAQPQAPQPDQTETSLDEATAQFEALGDTLRPEFTGDPEAGNAPETDAKFIEQIRSAFTGEPVRQSSPFAPKPKAAPKAAPEIFDLGDAPSWGELVAFVQRHGDVIIQARYPAPRGVAIDTIYRGVTVITHPTCELRHVKLGWIDWQDAQYEKV